MCVCVCVCACMFVDNWNTFDFAQAMFEIADHWTDDIDAKSYANFLRKLFRRITTLSKTVVDDTATATQNHVQTSIIFFFFFYIYIYF